MRNRSIWSVVLCAAPVLLLSSCAVDPALTSITINPTAMNFTGQGLTAQLIATGYYTRPNHAAVTRDITDTVKWISGSTDCVTVSSTGLIVSGENICSSIPVTASSPGFHGTISAFMTVNVAQPDTSAVTTVNIMPSMAAGSPGGSVRFTAVGRTADGRTVNLGGSTVWASSDNQVATIDKATGMLSTVGVGRTTISAVYTSPNGSNAVGVLHYNVTSLR